MYRKKEWKNALSCSSAHRCRRRQELASALHTASQRPFYRLGGCSSKLASCLPHRLVEGTGSRINCLLLKGTCGLVDGAGLSHGSGFDPRTGLAEIGARHRLGKIAALLSKRGRLTNWLGKGLSSLLIVPGVSPEVAALCCGQICSSRGTCKLLRSNKGSLLG